MRRSSRALLQSLFLLFSLGLVMAQGAMPSGAQEPSARAAASTSASAGDQASATGEAAQSTSGEQPTGEAQRAAAAEKSDSDSAEAYRHSPAVQYVARILHMPVETTAKIFEYLNFAILAGAILYFVFKMVPKIFRNRRDALARQLVDARTATEQANERLAGVEARLGRLDDEIAAIRRQVEHDAAEDEIRIKATLEEDKKHIAAAAGQEVEAAGAAAQRELRRFAAELAVERATRNLALTPEIDRQLVTNFTREIVGDSSASERARGARN